MMFDMISPEEAENYRHRTEVWLIDLRRKEAYQKEHIDGAYSVPYDQMREEMRTLPRNKLLILYCERGPTSFVAAKELAEEGYQVCVLVGGIRAWKKYRERKTNGWKS